MKCVGVQRIGGTREEWIVYLCILHVVYMFFCMNSWMIMENSELVYVSLIGIEDTI